MLLWDKKAYFHDQIRILRQFYKTDGAEPLVFHRLFHSFPTRHAFLLSLHRTANPGHSPSLLSERSSQPLTASILSFQSSYFLGIHSLMKVQVEDLALKPQLRNQPTPGKG